MIGRLNHVAIVVPDLQAASRLYRDTLGTAVSEPLHCRQVHDGLCRSRQHPGGTAASVETHRQSHAFSSAHPAGGMHHVCYEVPDILKARDQLKAGGARVLGSGEPTIGAHGNPVLFLHPADFCGTLVELEQV